MANNTAVESAVEPVTVVEPKPTNTIRHQVRSARPARNFPANAVITAYGPGVQRRAGSKAAAVVEQAYRTGVTAAEIVATPVVHNGQPVAPAYVRACLVWDYQWGHLEFVAPATK